MKAFARRETLEGADTFRAWIVTILENVCNDLAKTRPDRLAAKEAERLAKKAARLAKMPAAQEDFLVQLSAATPPVLATCPGVSGSVPLLPVSSRSPFAIKRWCTVHWQIRYRLADFVVDLPTFFAAMPQHSATVKMLEKALLDPDERLGDDFDARAEQLVAAAQLFALGAGGCIRLLCKGKPALEIDLATVPPFAVVGLVRVARELMVPPKPLELWQRTALCRLRQVLASAPPAASHGSSIALSSTQVVRP